MYIYIYKIIVVNITLILFCAGGLQLKDHNYLRLQFMGARNAWLGCSDTSNRVCDLRTCPSRNNQYSNFGICRGEVFQIIGDGTQSSAIKSGQRIRLRYLYEPNIWMGCFHNIIAVIKETALVQPPRVVTLEDVEEKSSKYMLVEELMGK